jgi:hypothetical protein
MALVGVGFGMWRSGQEGRYKRQRWKNKKSVGLRLPTFYRRNSTV